MQSNNQRVTIDYDVITETIVQTLNAGIFSFYKVEISALNKYENMYVKGLEGNSQAPRYQPWVMLQKIYNLSSTNAGYKYSIVPKAFVLLNRTYKISKTSETSIENAIISLKDFLYLLAPDDEYKRYIQGSTDGQKVSPEHIDSTILLQPIKYVKRIFTLLNIEDEIEDTFYVKPFFEATQLSPVIVSQMFSNMPEINFLNFLNVIYSSLGVLFFQDIPDIKDSSPKLGEITFQATNIINMNNLPEIPSDNDSIYGGLISLSDSIDFSKIKKFATYSMDDNGRISPINPWTGGVDFDLTSLKTHIERFDTKYVDQTQYMGSDVAYAINAPLLNFFKNAKISYKYEYQTNNQPQQPNTQTKTIKQIFSPKNKTDKARNLFAGEYYLHRILRNVASIRNMLNYLNYSFSVIGAIPHWNLLRIGQSLSGNDTNDFKLKVERFNPSTFLYEETDIELKLPEGTYCFLNVFIKKMISSDGETYITNATVFKLDDAQEYLLPKDTDDEKRKREFEEELKKLYDKIEKTKQDKQQNSSQSVNVAEDDSSMASILKDFQEYQSLDDVLGENLIEEAVQQCLIEEDPVLNLEKILFNQQNDNNNNNNNNQPVSK